MNVPSVNVLLLPRPPPPTLSQFRLASQQLQQPQGRLSDVSLYEQRRRPPDVVFDLNRGNTWITLGWTASRRHPAQSAPVSLFSTSVDDVYVVLLPGSNTRMAASGVAERVAAHSARKEQALSLPPPDTAPHRSAFSRPQDVSWAISGRFTTRDNGFQQP
ncbi:hypothetical protein BDZ89DRAFT_1142569 [Hymenopellis radicata]|nr:hypothetical protein BDZ89DRAFT_1142569 [Hymenopellis radicata]